MKSHPKRRFGQHFLRDTGILARLEREINPLPTDSIIEIGAGDGSLSVKVAPSAGRFCALEVDDDQIPSLEGALAPYSNSTVIHGDILEMDLEQLLRDMQLDAANTRLIGNLPYNIASAIIHRCLRLREPVRDMIYMVQLEVAQRIISSPHSRAYGVLSVDCQHRADVRLLFKVSPACFCPRPKVMSAVVQIRPRGIQAGTPLDRAFDDVVKAAFAHRRKTLENSYRRHPAIGPIAGALLESAGVQGTRRAEDLSVAEYERLAHAFIGLASDANQ